MNIINVINISHIAFLIDMDKAKVLEIIEPSSDFDGKEPASSFDTRKIRTDSLDDADDFPEKEVKLVNSIEFKRNILFL